MRWYKKTKPYDGEERCMEGFLLFPKEIKGEVRWLEVAVYKEKFYKTKTFWGWKSIKWVNLR